MRGQQHFWEGAFVARHILNEVLAWMEIPSTTSYWSIVRMCSAGGRLVVRTTVLYLSVSDTIVGQRRTLYEHRKRRSVLQ